MVTIATWDMTPKLTAAFLSDKILTTRIKFGKNLRPCMLNFFGPYRVFMIITRVSVKTGSSTGLFLFIYLEETF